MGRWSGSAFEQTDRLIENKVDSGEHSDQLVRYREFLEKRYGNIRRAFGKFAEDGMSLVSVLPSRAFVVVGFPIRGGQCVLGRGGVLG